MGVPNKRKYDKDEDDYYSETYDHQSTFLSSSSTKRLRVDNSMSSTVDCALTDRKRYAVYAKPLTLVGPSRVKEIVVPKSPFRVVREVGNGKIIYCDISHSEKHIIAQSYDECDNNGDYGFKQHEDALVFGSMEHNVFSKLVSACMQEAKEGRRKPLAFDGSKVLIDGFAYDQYHKLLALEQIAMNSSDSYSLLKSAKACDAVGDGFGSFPLFLPVNACRTSPMTRSLGVYNTYERYGFSMLSREQTKRTKGLLGVSELKSGNDLVDWILYPNIKWSDQALITPANGFFIDIGTDSGLASYQDYTGLSAWRNGTTSSGSTLSMLYRCDDELDMEIEGSRIPENTVCMPSWTDVSLRYSRGDLVSGKFALTSEALKTIGEPRRLWDVCSANGRRFVGPIMNPLFDIGFFGIEDTPFAQTTPEKYQKYSLNALPSLLNNPNNVIRHTLLRRASGGVQTLDKGGDFLDVALPFVAYNEYAKCIPESIDVFDHMFEKFGTTEAEVAEKLHASLSETLVRQNYFSGKIYDVQRRVDAFSKKYGTPIRDREGDGYYESSLLYEIKSPLALNQHSLEWTEMASYLGNDLKMPVTLNSIPLYNYEHTCGPDSWLASLHSAITMGADMRVVGITTSKLQNNDNDVDLSDQLVSPSGKIESDLTIRVDNTFKSLFHRFSEVLERFYTRYQRRPDLSIGAASVVHVVDQWSVLEKISLVTMLKWTIERHLDAIFSTDGTRGNEATMHFLSEKMMNVQTATSFPPTAAAAAAAAAAPSNDQSARIAWMMEESVKSFDRTGVWDRRYAEYVACLEVYESIVVPCLDDVSHYAATLVSGKNKPGNKVYGDVKIVKNPDQRADDFLRKKIAKVGSLTYGRMVSMEPLRRHWMGDAMTVGEVYAENSEGILQNLSDLYLNAKTLFKYSNCHEIDATSGEDVAEKGIYDLLILFEDTLGFDPRDVDVDFDRVDRACWSAQLVNDISQQRFKLEHSKRFEKNIAQKGEAAYYARFFINRKDYGDDDEDDDVPDFDKVAFLAEYERNMRYYDYSGRLQMDARAARYESVPLWVFGLNLNNAYSAADVMSNYCNLLTSTSAIRFDGRVNAKTMGLPEEFWSSVDEKLSACQNIYAVNSNKSTTTMPPTRSNGNKDKINKPSFPAAMLRGKSASNKVITETTSNHSPYVDGAVSGSECLLHHSMSDAANEVRLRSIPKYAESDTDDEEGEAKAALENDKFMFVSTKLENRSKVGAKNVDFRRIADIDAESLLHVRDLMRYHAYDAIFLAVYASKINSFGIHQTNKMDWNTGGCCVGNLMNVPYGPNYRSVEDFSLWQFGRPFRNKPSYLSNLLNVTSGTHEAKYKRNALRASVFVKTCPTSLTALRNFIMSKDVFMDTRTSESSGIPFQKGVHEVTTTKQENAKDYRDFLGSLETLLDKKLSEHNAVHAMAGVNSDEIDYSALLLSDDDASKLKRLFDRGGVWTNDSDDIAYGAGDLTLLDFLNKVKNETRLKQGCKKVLQLWQSETSSTSLKNIAGGETFAMQFSAFLRRLDNFSEAHLSLEPVKKFSKFGVVSYAPINCWDALYNDNVSREFESLTPEGFDLFVDAVMEAATQISSEREMGKKRELEASLLASLRELRSEMAASSGGGVVKFYNLARLSEFYVEGMRRGIVVARLFGKGTMPLSFYSAFYDNDSASVHAMYAKNVPPYLLDAAIYPFYVTGAYSTCKLHKMVHFVADSDIFCGGKDTSLPQQLRCDTYKAFCFDTMGIHDAGKFFKFPNGVKALSANQLSWGLTASHLFLGDSFSLEFGSDGLTCLSLGSICVISLNLEKIAEYYTDGSLTQEIYVTLIESKNMFLNVARRTSSYSDLKVDSWNEFERSVFCACKTYDTFISNMSNDSFSSQGGGVDLQRHAELAAKKYYSERIKDTGCRQDVPKIVLKTYSRELSELLAEEINLSADTKYGLTPELWTMIVLYKTFFEVKKYVPTGFVINDSSSHFVSEFSLPSWYSSNADDLLKPVSGRFDLEREMDGLRGTSKNRTDGMPGIFENDTTNRGRWYYYDDLYDTFNEQSRNIAQNFDHASKKWLGMDEKDLEFEKVPATLAYASNPSSWIHALNTNVHVKCDTSTPSSTKTSTATGIQRMYNVMVLDCRDDIARKEQVLLDAGYTVVDGDEDETNTKKYSKYITGTKESLQRWKDRVDGIFQELDSKKTDAGSKISRLPLLMRNAKGVEEVKPLQKYLVFTEGSQIRLNTVHYVLEN